MNKSCFHAKGILPICGNVPLFPYEVSSFWDPVFFNG